MSGLNIDELSVEKCREIAWNPNTSESVLMELAGHSDRKVVLAALRHSSMPLWFLRSALESERPEMRAFAVGDMRLSLETVAGAIHDEDKDVVRVLAGRDDLSPELMWELASHPSFEVAQAVGRRTGLPVEVGVLLAVGRMGLNLKTVRPDTVNNALFPFKVFGLWLQNKDGSLLYAKAGELPLELVLEWLAEQGDKIMVNNYYMKYVEHTLVPNMRTYVEARTSITGLPDAWVVRTFRTLLGVV